MSLSEEKILILKMLEEGKITSEEAAKLIEALQNGEKQAASGSAGRQQKQPNFQDEVAKVRDRLNEWKKEFQNNYNQKDFDRIIDEFSSKAEKLGKNVAYTTFGLVDKVIDFVGSFVDTNTFNFFGSCPTVEKSFETPATDGMELEVEATNGAIVVKKHLDNKIVIKSRIKSRSNNADNVLMFTDEGNTVSLKLNNPGNVSVYHEVFLPAAKFKKISLTTANGRIYAEDSLAESFNATTRNGNIELMGVNSDAIVASTKNSRIQVSYVIGKNIEIETTNSVIDIKHIKAENVKVETTNGRILVENAQNYEGITEMNLVLKTTNGGIKINMNDMDQKGYKVRAKTTNGGINLLIPEMIYHNVNRQGPGGNFVEAESNGYDIFNEKVNISCETTNGYIEIVK